MKNAGRPITSDELANMTQIAERNIRERLTNQAAGGYITYDPETLRYWLPHENALALADENSTIYSMAPSREPCLILRLLLKLRSHLEQAKVIHGANMTLISS
jgi:hypothetical protein